MSDYISRQAAISAICNACGKIDCDKMDKCEKLQLPPANCSEFPNNSDTISRQAAIDRAVSIPMFGRDVKMVAVSEIKNLPSAQPEPLTDKEQRIFLAAMGREEKVCKQVDKECRDCGEPYEDSLVWVCHEIVRKVKGTMGDLIDRRAAIEALAKTMPTLATPDGAGEFDHEIHIADEAFADAIRIIESLEPADVVPVIRCDDCVYYGSRRWCELHSSVFNDNAFCSYGERKEA